MWVLAKNMLKIQILSKNKIDISDKSPLKEAVLGV